MKLELDCVRHGRYTIGEYDRLLHLSCVPELEGIHCFQCTSYNEAQIRIDGKIASIPEVRSLAKKLFMALVNA
jgi:hypothetical protein